MVVLNPKNEMLRCYSPPFNILQGLVIFSIPIIPQITVSVKCLSVADGKPSYLKWHLWRYASQSEQNPSRHSKVPRHWSWPVRALCQAEFGGLTKWIICPHPNSTCLFFFFFICVCVCWAMAKRTGVWAPARCIDPTNQLHHTSFQVLAERIIIA